MGMFSTTYSRGVSSSNVLTNQRQAGPQMAGLVPTETASVAQARAYQIRGSRKTQSFLSMPLYSTTRPSRPIGTPVNIPFM